MALSPETVSLILTLAAVFLSVSLLAAVLMTLALSRTTAERRRVDALVQPRAPRLVRTGPTLAERVDPAAEREPREIGPEAAGPRQMAQYHCEMAAGVAAARPDQARRHLETALEENRKCVRASLQLGDLEKSGGKPEKAIEQWKRIESQDPAYLALAAQRLAETHRETSRADEGVRLLAGYLERYPSLDLLDTVFTLTLEAKGADEAYKLVRDELRRNPTLLGLDRLLEAQIVGADAPGQKRDLELVRSLVHGHTRRLARYRCEACGFKARQFYWRCPACGGWETYPPRRTEEFELTP